jgi:hypothetical protein
MFLPFYFIYLYFWVVLRFELVASLARQELYHLSQTPVFYLFIYLFALVIFHL